MDSAEQSRGERSMGELKAEFNALRESIPPGGPSLAEILADSRRELELRALRPFPQLLTDDDRAFLARQDEILSGFSYRADGEVTPS